MIILVIILIVILFIALYPALREVIRRRRIILPAYTEGLALLLEGNQSGAIDKFKQAIQRDSNNIDAYLRLSELYLTKGEIERTIQILEALALRRTLDKNQESKIFHSLGQVYLKTERWAKALTIFEELTKIDDKDLKNFEILLFLYERTERWEKCNELLKKLGKIQKDKKYLSFYYAELGKTISNKDPERALGYYRAALRFDRNSVPALIYLGEYYYAQGDINQAIENWRNVLQNNPQYYYLIRNRIEAAYYDLGKYEEMIEVYNKLTSKIPDDAMLYTALAQIYEKKEDVKSAIAILAKAPISDSKGFLAQLNLINLQIKDGAAKKAEWVLSQLIEQLQNESQNYRCGICGFESKQFQWQCPKCWNWESMIDFKIRRF
jgi:lipopolysaccharide biosynthesis regulator YciM